MHLLDRLGVVRGRNTWGEDRTSAKRKEQAMMELALTPKLIRERDERENRE